MVEKSRVFIQSTLRSHQSPTKEEYSHKIFAAFVNSTLLYKLQNCNPFLWKTLIEVVNEVTEEPWKSVQHKVVAVLTKLNTVVGRLLIATGSPWPQPIKHGFWKKQEKTSRVGKRLDCVTDIIFSQVLQDHHKVANLCTISYFVSAEIVKIKIQKVTPYEAKQNKCDLWFPKSLQSTMS